jgi:hypothetical protein
MGRSPYRSEKRRKELARLKKQEEKRERRFNKKSDSDSPEKDKLSAIPTVQFGIDGLPIEPAAEDAPEEGDAAADQPQKDQESGPST